MSSEIKRNLEESMVLQNFLLNILPKMMKEGRKEFYEFVRPRVNKNSTDVCDSMRKEVCVNLLKEIFALLNQAWTDNPKLFDEGLIKEKSVYNLIKSQIKGDRPFPFNNKELYKRIRECIVHNSLTNQNFSYDLKKFELNLGKVNDENYIVEMSFAQLYNLVIILLSNFKNHTNRITSVHIDEDIETREDIKNKIKIIDLEQSTYNDLEDGQVERIYNYFRFIKKEMDFSDETEIGEALYSPNNVERLILEKFSAFDLIKSMNFKSTWKNLEKKNNLKKVEVLDVYNAIVTNLLFTYASSQTNEELYEVLHSCVPSLTTDDVRHIRNSLCHGRYFHDYYKNFYFYDGKKTLKYEVKLTIDNINKILDKVTKGEKGVNILLPF